MSERAREKRSIVWPPVCSTAKSLAQLGLTWRAEAECQMKDRTTFSSRSKIVLNSIHNRTMFSSRSKTVLNSIHNRKGPPGSE